MRGNTVDFYISLGTKPDFRMTPTNRRLIVTNHRRRKLFQINNIGNGTRRLSASYGNLKILHDPSNQLYSLDPHSVLDIHIYHRISA